MRINALRIAGFGPFRREQRIDFDQFADDGVFLISGKTGSGKSSVLDAITFALYGSVPRYEGQSKQGIRSHHAAPEDPSYVELEFEFADTRYLLRREPEYERPKRRGEGMTKHSAAAQLSQRIDGEWQGIAAKPVDVAKALAEVLPLSQVQFLQVVLLAQNRFQEFLHASTADRQAVLRALFSTERFQRLTASLADARRAAVAEAEAASATVQRISEEIEAFAPTKDADSGSGIDSRLDSETDTDTDTDSEIEIEIDAISGTKADTKLDVEPGTEHEDAKGTGTADRDSTSQTPTASRRRPTLSLAEAETRLDFLVRAAGAAATDATETARRQEQADAALGEAKRLLELQSRRTRLTEERAKLEGESSNIAAARLRLQLAQAAAPLASGIQRCDATASTLRATSSARTRALDALLAHLPELLEASAGDGHRTADGAGSGVDGDAGGDAGGDADRRAGVAAGDRADGPEHGEHLGCDLEPGPGVIEGLVEEAARTLGATDELLQLEKALPGARKSLEKLRAAQQDNAAELTKATGELELVPERRSLLHESITSGEVQAAAAPAAAEHLERMTGLVELAVERAACATDQVAALERSARLSEQAGAAASTERSLIARRLASSAAVLAQGLFDDEPCPVCGSREHPAPAPDEGTDDVSDEALERARVAAAHANDQHSAAQLALSALVQRASALDARLGGQSSEQLEQQLAEAKVRVAAASDAVTTLSGLREELAALDQHEQSQTRVQASARARDGELASEISALTARIASDTARVDAALQGFASIDARQVHVRRTRELAEALLRQTRDREAAKHAAAEAEAQLDSALEGTPFGDRDSASAAMVGTAESAQLDARIRTHEQSLAAVSAALADPSLRDVPSEPADVQGATEARAAASKAHNAQISRQAQLEEQAKRLGDLVGQLGEVLGASEELLATAETLRVLAGTLSGQEPNEKRMSLEAYVLAAELEEVVTAANAQLARMTASRYSLEHDDSLQYRGAQSGLGLRIADAYTGRSRATESLSGGETFLASLALALGLAETVTARAGGIRLDTLFIDEGFGSLDGETLGAAMATLDRLRSGGRTIGVISHVEAMQEQITSKLRVAVDAHGESSVVAGAS